MAKSTKSTTASAPVLAGLTAVQIRELIDTKQVTAKAAVEFLVAKEAAHRLRAPAKKLLGELTGAAPAKAAEPKPAAKAAEPKPVAKAAEPKPVAKADDLAEIIGKAVAGALAPVLARLDAVEAKLSAAKPAPATKPEPVKPAKAAEPVKAKPAPAAKPEPVKPAPAAKPAKAAKPAAKATMSEAEARAEFASLKLAQLRDIADFDTAGMSKSAIIDEMVTQSIGEGVVIAAAPVKAGKPNLKVVAREVAVVF